jgi:hypothetical protein
VAGEEHRHAAGGPLAQHRHDRVDRERVESGERFVQDEQVRIVDQGGRDLGPLLVAE